MNTNQLETFLKIASYGSFAKASQAMFVTPSALIQQMQNLEREVGFKIYQRGTKGLHLTRAGEELYQTVGQTIRDFDKAVDKCRTIAGEDEGVLRIALQSRGIFPPVMTMKLCFAYKAARPDIRLELVDTDYPSLTEDLKNDRFDVAASSYLPKIDQMGLQFQKTFQASAYCLMSQQHPLAQKTFIAPQDLRGQKLYVNSCYNEVPLMDALQKIEPSLCAQAAEVDTFTVFSHCLDGGIYLMHLCAVSVLPPLSLVPLAVDPHWYYGLITKQSPTPAAKDFLQFAEEFAKG